MPAELTSKREMRAGFAVTPRTPRFPVSRGLARPKRDGARGPCSMGDGQCADPDKAVADRE